MHTSSVPQNVSTGENECATPVPNHGSSPFSPLSSPKYAAAPGLDSGYGLHDYVHGSRQYTSYSGTSHAKGARWCSVSCTPGDSRVSLSPLADEYNSPSPFLGRTFRATYKAILVRVMLLIESSLGARGRGRCLKAASNTYAVQNLESWGPLHQEDHVGTEKAIGKAPNTKKTIRKAAGSPYREPRRHQECIRYVYIAARDR